ncbi:MAG: aldo/keto reductase, partial [Verrucomicrobiota bacterium]
PAVKSVIPTLIQETDGKPIETKVDELASLPEIKLSADECGFMAEIGDNKGCMQLKGANQIHTGEAEADKWSLTNDLEEVGKRWSINPRQDLAHAHADPTSK